jgi:peptidoglycan hydrolase-like protein with peptidoglycan-binding domain
MARMPGATWMPIPVNHTPGGQAEVRGVVVHIMAGTLAGTDSWFRNPRAQASSHFGTGRTGQLRQWVDTADRAWAQGAGNRSWLSVENEGHGGDELTDAQIDANARVLAWAHQRYGVPLQATNDPQGRGLGHHGMGGQAWGGHTSCPGTRIVHQKRLIVAKARLLVGAAPIDDDKPPAWPGRLLMYVKGRPMMSGRDVRVWQALLNREVHAGIVVDGQFGPATARWTRALQARLKEPADGIVGPNTWRKAW